MQSLRWHSVQLHFQRSRLRRHLSQSGHCARLVLRTRQRILLPYGCYRYATPYYAQAGAVAVGWGWGGPCWGCGPFSHDRRFFDRDARFFRNGRFFDRDGRFFHDGRFSRAGLGGPGFARGGFGGPGMMRGGFGGGRR